MDPIFEGLQTPPALGELIEGEVISLDTGALYVDLPPFGTGVIFGREFIIARDLIKKIRVGDSVTAKIVDTGNKDGYVELSLKEAKQAMIWGEVEAAIKEKSIFELPVQDANKGGLILAWQGVQGFLPASQLKPEHYPRVMDGNKERILEELQKLVGEKLTVSIIGATEEDGKLIFSEKQQATVDTKDVADKYKLGDVISGEVTGMVDFGIFVKLQDGLEGLVHISELSWSLVEDPRNLFKVGEKIDVKVIDVKEGKVSLSIKALTENPWESASKKYKKKDVVQGVIIKFNKHGALASIEEGVAGLVHVSDFEDEDELREKLELGKTYDFRISLFEPKEQKMTLTTKLSGKEEEK